MLIPNPISADRTDRAPRRRVILLGASNLTICFPTFVRVAARCLGEPIEILTAQGLGRSLDRSTNVFGRGLPGILHAGLWRTWEDSPVAPAVGLLTDVGNDFFYGATTDQIAGWTRECLARMRPRCERLTLTTLPIENARTISEMRFRLFRAVCFPSSAVTLERLRIDGAELNARLKSLAREFDADLIEQPSAWYGFDPLHYRPTMWNAIVAHVLRNWRTRTKKFTAAKKYFPNARAELGTLRWWCGGRPAAQELFGRAQRRTQPCLRLDDGSTIASY